MDNLEEIKKKIDLVEYVGKVVSLKKAGRNFVACCPFHSEKTPSFVVSPERQIWHCFGACGEGGDIFKFVMKWENISFPEALAELAKQTGVTLSHSAFSDKAWRQKEILLSINTAAADFFQYLLQKHRFGEEAREYLKKRTLNEKIIEHFGLGWAPQSWDSLIHYLTKKNFLPEQIEQTGLLVRSQGNKYYDRFRGRIMFPLKDMRGNVVGFSGRTLLKDSKTAKYINSPETPLYHKRENLFALNLAKEHIIRKKEIILMEGEFDAILAHQNGFTQAVAIKGSALTEDHLNIIKRLTSHLIFALDMDLSGNEAAKKGIMLAEKYEFQMEVIVFDKEKDPADIFAKNPVDFKEVYKNKISVYEFLINQAKAKYSLTDIYQKNKIIEEVMPFLNRIYNPVIADFFLKKLGSAAEVNMETLQKAKQQYFSKKFAPKKTALTALPTKPVNRWQALEEHLLALLLQSGEQKLIFEQSKLLNKEDFSQPASYKLFKLVEEAYQKNPAAFLQEFPSQLPTPLVDLYNKSLLLPFLSKNHATRQEIKKTVLAIKKISLKKQIQEALAGEQTERYQLLSKEMNEVEKSLAIL